MNYCDITKYIAVTMLKFATLQFYQNYTLSKPGMSNEHLKNGENVGMLFIL